MLHKTSLILVLLLGLSKTYASYEPLYKVEPALVEDMVRLCLFAKGRDYPDDLRLKGMAWCDIANQFISEEYPKKYQQVTKILNDEKLQSLKAHQKYPHFLRLAKRKFANQALSSLQEDSVQ